MNTRLKILFYILVPLAGYAQSGRDSIYDPKKEVIVKGNRFKYYNNWLNGGAGYGQDWTHTRDIFWIGLDYNFHIKKDYFQVGGYFSGRDFGDYDNYHGHAGYLWRWEKISWNFAAFGGASYSSGYRRTVTGQYDYSDPYNEFGLYAGGQAIWKFKYDIGIGLSGIANWNPYAFAGGLRLDIYFSGAYKGKTVKQ